MRIVELFKSNEDSKLVLPDFQRDFEWNVDAQKKFLGSILVHLPVGSLLILNGNKEDFATKKLCFAIGNVEPKEECIFLLDGQQRVSSLKSIFSDFFCNKNEWINVWEGLYKDLRKRWFIRIKPNYGEEDIFGWEELKFRNVKKCEPSQLIDFIHVEHIHKTKTHKWFNPGFNAYDEVTHEELEGNRIKNFIASKAAEEFIVPLYSIYSSDNEVKKLHEYVIDKIARNRIDELKADVNDGRRNIENLLEEVEPDIKAIKDFEKIRDCWARLAASWAEQLKAYLEEVINQDISAIRLPADEINRAISIFESINKGGTPLSVYDLVVARAARDKGLGSLNQRIIEDLMGEFILPNSLVEGLIGSVPNVWNASTFDTVIDNKVDGSFKDNYLNLLSILSNTNYGFRNKQEDERDINDIKLEMIKRPAILDLSYEQINNKTQQVVKAIKRAYAFLHFRCGVISVKNIQYKLMVLPIAYIFSNDEMWNDKEKLDKIEYWYWTMLFSGGYRERQNDQCIKDIKNLYDYVTNGNNHYKNRENRVLNDPGYSDQDLLLMKDEEMSIPSAIHNAILQYIISTQPRDFLENDIRLNAWDIAENKKIEINGKERDLRVQDHHICPLSQAASIGESTEKLRKDKSCILNSVLNRTYISEFANSHIRDKAPSEYFDYVSECSLWGHCIPTPVKDKFNINNYSNRDTYYKTILKERYNELRKTIVTELDKLRN